MKVVDEDDNDVAHRRGGRDRHPRPQRHEGLLEARPTRPQEVMQGRLVPHRRHGHGRRGGLLLHRRSQEGHDHPRRLQRLPARDRGGALRAPGGSRGGRDRRCRTTTLGEEVGAAVVLKDGASWTPQDAAARYVQGERRGLQVPAPRSGSSTSCPRGRRARSSSARSLYRKAPTRSESQRLQRWRFTVHSRTNAIDPGRLRPTGRGSRTRRSAAFGEPR